jgi:hypothetical protein
MVSVSWGEGAETRLLYASSFRPSFSALIQTYGFPSRHASLLLDFFCSPSLAVLGVLRRSPKNY